MPSYVSPKKGVEFIFYISLVSQANTKVMQSNPTIAAGDFKVSIDGGALANPATLPAVTPASSKMVKVTLSTSEMNGDNVTLIASDASGAEWCDLVVNIQTSARQIDDLAYPATSGRSTAIDASGQVTVGAIANNAITAAAIATDAIDADAIADNAINAAAIASDALTAAKFAADVTTELQSGLATAASIATLQTSVDDLPTNAELATSQAAADDATLAAIAALNNLSAAQVNAEVDTALADVGLTTTITGRIDAAVSTRSTVTTAQVNSEVDTALADYDAPTKAELDSAVATLATAANLATVAGYLDTEIAAILAAVDTEIGALTTSVADLPTNAELATALGTADDATLAAIAALSVPSANTIADAVLSRGVSNVQDTADTTSLAALILATFESAVVGTTWTIRKTGGTTFATKTVTVDADADPITGVT